MKKTKDRNENILDTLKNNEWFINKCSSLRTEYKKRGNDNVFLRYEVRRVTRYLPAYWETSVSKYIKTSLLEKPSISAQVVFMPDKDRNEQALYIRIFQKTTKKDVEKAFKEAKKFQKLIPEILAREVENNLVVLKVWEEVESRKVKPRNIARAVSQILYERYKISLEESTIRKMLTSGRRQFRAGRKQH